MSSLPPSYSQATTSDETVEAKLMLKIDGARIFFVNPSSASQFDHAKGNFSVFFLSPSIYFCILSIYIFLFFDRF